MFHSHWISRQPAPLGPAYLHQHSQWSKLTCSMAVSLPRMQKSRRVETVSLFLTITPAYITVSGTEWACSTIWGKNAQRKVHLSELLKFYTSFCSRWLSMRCILVKYWPYFHCPQISKDCILKTGLVKVPIWWVNQNHKGPSLQFYTLGVCFKTTLHIWSCKTIPFGYFQH